MLVFALAYVFALPAAVPSTAIHTALKDAVADVYTADTKTDSEAKVRRRRRAAVGRRTTAAESVEPEQERESDVVSGDASTAASEDVESAESNAPMSNQDDVAQPVLAAREEPAVPAVPVDEEEHSQAQAADSQAQSDVDYASAVRTRRDLGTVHRYLGIATWVAMTATVVSGIFQYYNLYGFGAGINNNPCATGGAIFGQDQCSGTPWFHRVGWITTSALYTATFTLSLLMPDPNDISSARGGYADRMRAHKLLRWIHFGGMLVQMVLGLGVANGWFGDRANDYGTLQAIATVHQVTGLVTWGSLTAAGALMTF